MLKVFVLTLSLCSCATFQKGVKPEVTKVAKELEVCKPELMADVAVALPAVAVYVACMAGNAGDNSKCSGELQQVKATTKDEAAQCAMALIKDAQCKIANACT